MTVPQNEDIPSIAGLDTAEGLARVGGNRKLYLTLLRQFVAENTDAANQITAQLKSSDHAVAERTAHTVKGVAGNLGAKSVHSAAAELEKAIREHASPDQVETTRQRFAEQLSALTDALRPALGQEQNDSVAPPAKPSDPEQLKPVVEQMRKLLSEFDAAAGDHFETNRTLFAAFFSAEEITQFKKHLQNYAFAEAQALLEKIVSRNKISIT
jgi:HPt (histidine-containing phosphotransfer) domain-containing protein